MKITGGTIAAIVAVLMLTGCANVAPEKQNGALRFADVAESTASRESAPEIETPSDADATFLAYVEAETPDFTETALPDMTQPERIAAGHDACVQMGAGVAMVDLRLVPGEEPSIMGDYLDSSAIFNGALLAYCPELMVRPEGN